MTNRKHDLTTLFLEKPPVILRLDELSQLVEIEGSNRGVRFIIQSSKLTKLVD